MGRLLGIGGQVGSTTVRDLTDDEVTLSKVDLDRSDTASRYKCDNCGFTRAYTFFWRRPGYGDRQVRFCPGCGFPILGVVGHA